MPNNALLDSEEIDITTPLKERRAELTRLTEAINNLVKTDDYRVVKEMLFDKTVNRLEKSLQLESKKDELDAPMIYRLNGELTGTKRYSDLYKLAETYRAELNNITKKLNENA